MFTVTLPAAFIRDIGPALEDQGLDVDRAAERGDAEDVPTIAYLASWDALTINGRGTGTIHLPTVASLRLLLADAEYREEFNRPTRNGENPYGNETPDYDSRVAAAKVRDACRPLLQEALSAAAKDARPTYADTPQGCRLLVENEMAASLRDPIVKGIEDGTLTLHADPEVNGVWGLFDQATHTVVGILYNKDADFEVDDRFFDSLAS